MRVAITGARGLVGTAVTSLLEQEGHEVFRLVRTTPQDDQEIAWNVGQDCVDVERLREIDAVIHLAGENVGEGRWTQAKKEKILRSRVDGTRLLCEAVRDSDPQPKIFLCAAAIGFYGSRGELLCDESTSPGTGFLADVCQQWEAATDCLEPTDVRLVNMRIGVVLSTLGGAISKMVRPFRLGVGGKVGDGKQYWSWIELEDLARAIVHCLNTSSLSGRVNLVAPNPATNLDFTKALGKALHRPAILPMPAFAARLALGEMADDLLLSSTRVASDKLAESGFIFKHVEINSALKHILK